MKIATPILLLVLVACLIYLYALSHHRVFGGETAIDTSTTSGVAQLEDSYFAKNGTYYQVLPNNQTPPSEPGTVQTSLGQTIGSQYAVNTYQSPIGVGYFITYEDGAAYYSVGYGPEAAMYDSTITKGTSTATTTP